MVQSGAYFDVVDWLERQGKFDPSAFLAKLQSAYGLGPITYVDATINNGHLRTYSLHHSVRQDAQMVHRLLHRRAGLDHLLKAFSALEPQRLTPLARPSVATSPHLATLAYTLPALPGRHSCLLVTTELAPPDLKTWRLAHDRDLLSLGAKLNARVSRSAGIERLRPTKSLPLTRRESETLAWIAAGKSYWETAVILGISERTIRYFMANAREKLDVVSNAQAVAEAVWRGLIPRLAEPGTR